MTTRLDRLFILLDTGSTPLIRKSAADQLGHVQKLHPHELQPLLTKVHHFLGSNSWDTRIAAGQAVEAICSNVPIHLKKEAFSGTDEQPLWVLAMQHFDVAKVIANGASLMASEGSEFDLHEDLGMNQYERLVLQKQLLAKRLGLDIATDIATEDFFQDEDLLQSGSTSVTIIKGSQSASSIEENVIEELHKELSCREKNHLKRKVRRMNSRQVSMDADGGEPSAKIQRFHPFHSDQLKEDNNESQSGELKGDEALENFTNLLLNDIFHPSWEKRHGAAVGLRELVKVIDRASARSSEVEGGQACTQHWLVDIAVRLVCVMALDRFGDFITDEVVAPVRETCAQALGLLSRVLARSDYVVMVGGLLLQLLEQPQWEVRHGGLLGLKYILAARQDVCTALLHKVLPGVQSGLADPCDDVRAVAASTLQPVADHLVMSQPNQVVEIVHCVWEAMRDLDELTSATASMMGLLSSLVAHPNVPQQCISGSMMSQWVPLLFPFMEHNIVTVRLAVLQTVTVLFKSASTKMDEASWATELAPSVLRLLYQRCLLEDKETVLNVITTAWQSVLSVFPLDKLTYEVAPIFSLWMCLAMQHPKLPFDKQNIIRVSFHKASCSKGKEPDGSGCSAYIGGSQSGSPTDNEAVVIRARLLAATLLGEVCARISSPAAPLLPAADGTAVEPVSTALGKLLQFHLVSKAALQRLVAACVVKQWVVLQKCYCPQFLQQQLLTCLAEPSFYYDEIAPSFTRLQSECSALLRDLLAQGLDVHTFASPGTVLTLERAHELATSYYDSVKNTFTAKNKEQLDSRRMTVESAAASTASEQTLLHIRVQCSVVSAVVELGTLPDKMNPVIRPLMDGAKKEENLQLQLLLCQSLGKVLRLCVNREPCPNSKICKNLANQLCCDPEFTPSSAMDAQPVKKKGGKRKEQKKQMEILSLTALAKDVTEHYRGRRAVRNTRVPYGQDLCFADTDIPDTTDEGRRALLVQRRGAMLALTQMVQQFEDQLPQMLPGLWDILHTSLNCCQPGLHIIDCGSEELVKEVITALQVFEVVLPSFHIGLSDTVLTDLAGLTAGLGHTHPSIRHMASRCFASAAKYCLHRVMEYIVEKVVPMLSVTENEQQRAGSVETVFNCVDQLGFEIVPYLIFLVVPVLGCMSDQVESIRLLATLCFAELVKLVPLESGIPDPPMMKSCLVAQKIQERKFLEQLQDSRKVEPYQVDVPIHAELRKYQEDGVNWMAFLNRYQLHGILCDDMGLGKTLQSICILAGDTDRRRRQYEAASSPDCSPLPSIVVCPTTLTGHWVYEVQKFVDKEYLDPLHYTGTPSERSKLQKVVSQHNLVIASYDVVRNDIDFFSKLHFNYCVLDEGHIIKNSRTKISQSVKQLQCKHRLILSGTPIQNNVLELWSLFDFLMPGFLGSEKQFQAHYGRPILQSRDAKSSSKEQEAGALAMEALHRQVLPFILRRLKEEVLKDLPPKIMQDYYCDLSPLQVRLYEDLAKSRLKQDLLEGVANMEEVKKPTQHVFQALQYLRKVCNHPALVLTPQHPQYDEICKDLEQQKSTLQDLHHAPKLLALRQLLLDCGIGVQDTSSEAELAVVGQHRVLLFCQHKSMLDIVETDLLMLHMPTVTYMRLDGSVPASSRHDIVQKFNNDPSVDVLLLTTLVGGLGLNLTGADTVIFVEHDWNPMKDLQAMDRAHRIGQKNVVNVYRLITRGTLEEKIMSLQKFKINIAQSVITQENSHLSSMETDQLLDLFNLGAPSTSNSRDDAKKDGDRKGVCAVLEGLGELWDSKQYEEEYSIGAFMDALK